MNTIAQEAATEALLFSLGVRSTEDLTHWADHWIGKECNPPYALIELSTANLERVEDYISNLSILKGNADFWEAMRMAMPDLHDYILKMPAEAERIASSLFMLVIPDLDSMPKEFNFIFHFEDAFYLGREKIHGSVEEVYADFVTELAKFSRTAEQDGAGNRYRAP